MWKLCLLRTSLQLPLFNKLSSPIFLPNGSTLSNDDNNLKLKKKINFIYRLDLVIRAFLILERWGIPVHFLTLCFLVVLENPCFITSDDISEQVRFFYKPSHDVRANVFLVVLLFLSEVFRYHFCSFVIFNSSCKYVLISLR